MASPSIKTGQYRGSGKSVAYLPLDRIPLLPRRLAAWTLEVSLIAASILVPYGIGAYTDSRWEDKRVPLNGVLTEVEEAIAQTLALPRRQTQHQVAPSTNLLWWVALASPLALTGWQIYLLGKTGQTSPKRWLGIRAIATSGRYPGLVRAIWREGLGKWGLPTGTAYFIWRYSGAFPAFGVLVGLTGVAILLEAGVLGAFSRRRPLHDRLAGTVVVDAKRETSAFRLSQPDRRPQSSNLPAIVEVQIPKPSAAASEMREKRLPPKATQGIVIRQERSSEPALNLWLWMRQHPGVTLLLFTLAGMSLVLSAFVGTQVYIQSQTDLRQSEEQKNEAFLSLVGQLGASSPDPIEERKSVILALARLDDPRSIPLLVDLLGQESNPVLIDTLQQAIASVGMTTLPALRQLNQSLSNQLQSLAQGEPSKERELTALRLRGTKQAIAKLLVLYGSQLDSANLSHSDLSSAIDGSGEFTLILDGADLSGLNFRSAILTQASFRGSFFNSGGRDKRLGTFDDAIADLSGTDLREADLTDAFLTYVSLNKANLMQVSLNNANLSHAQLLDVNLSGAQAIGTNFTQADLTQASLTGANFAEANFTGAKLQQANLGQTRGINADFSNANLVRSTWQGSDLSEANFRGANLEKADLSASQLKRANLSNTNLQNANLSYANLSTADLRGSNLVGANFLGVTFTTESVADDGQFLKKIPPTDAKTKIEGVDFSEVKNLSPTQLEFICNNGGYHTQCSWVEKKER